MNPPATVYVVDDDDGARECVEALALSKGVPAATFASAEEFLQTYECHQPGCVVTDLWMLGMNGLELQAELKERQCRIPVILMTAYGEVPVAVKAMEQGAVMVLEKPCYNTQLWEAIAKALQVDAERRAQDAVLRQIEDRLSELTPSEREVLDAMVGGLPNKSIAKRLDVSVRTVENRRQVIFRKLGVNSVAAVVQLVLRAEGKLNG